MDPILIISLDIYWLNQVHIKYIRWLLPDIGFKYQIGRPFIRRNEAAIEICMHDVTDFRRPYTVIESTTAESKTSLFSYFVHGIFFSGHRNIDLTPPRIQFTTSCQIIIQIRGSHGDTKFEAMQSIDLHCRRVWKWRKYQYLHISFIVFGYYLNDLHLSGHWIRLT